jgi:DNA polymerase-3 subunit epsilon
MRQIVLDTETTGLESSQGHRIIEVAGVELQNRRVTGRHIHFYLDPEREVDEGARQIHGMSRADLIGKPRFADVAAELSDFMVGSELIIHNAAFDLAFLNAEFARLPNPTQSIKVEAVCTVLDTLLLAREKHPGQRNSLDALCKRYSIDNSHRDWHGALLDAQLLAHVYLAMTGGQSALVFADAGEARRAHGTAAAAAMAEVVAVRVITPAAAELAAHEQLVALIDGQSGGRCLWRQASAKH